MDGGSTLGRGHVFPLENYKKGARVWHRHPELVWISGELEHDVTFATKSVKIRLDNDQSVEVTVNSADQLPFLKNPAILVGKDDLTSLSYLHEPAVLHNLQYRFVEREQIYTYCGIVLVAINPYADCSHIYGEDVIQVYRGVGKQVRELDPHIYAVAEEAFFDLSEFSKCQSIIVSGESGAGKTVSAKFVMRYFASIASSRKGSQGIEDKVLASNPIMEAIGNAKTIRNDNSSRFGKFIQINFGDRFAISGAEMKTYLLEKSRLVFQAQNERNYHIFYQMCKSRDNELVKDLHIGTCESYHYTSQGGDSRIPGVDDKSDFDETVKALGMLGFTVEQQKDVFRLLAGVLMLGNIQFADGDEDRAAITSSLSELSRLCTDLYGISPEGLQLWLTAREIRAAGEVVRKGLDVVEAKRSRDALTKMLYAQLFHWLVDKINDSLMPPENRTRRAQKFIGVLDIYGFETFDVNSFEQFCINYANEKLQQQFNQHVFKLEQEEYEREEIAWVRIDFHDNQPTIDLIEGRPGLIDYLDEQCKVVKGSDDGWLNQMTNCGTLKKNPQLQLPRIRSKCFIVKHFAADVAYTVDGFLDKNKDTVSEQLLEVVSKTKFHFLLEVLGSNAVLESSTGAKRIVKRTVASQFRDSLRELMTVLCSTRPHYVRCIKPNDVKERYYFEPKRAIQQLRACGVLETVRISAAGFPSRWLYEEFGRRYRVLFAEGGSMWRDKPKQFAEKACSKALEEGKFALGKTKIFFRTGQVALLERIRLETLSVSATIIQARWRGFVARRHYEKIKQSIRTMQAATRAFLAYRRLKYLQMHRAAICIQSAVRGYQARKRYEKIRDAVIAIQSIYRAQKVRRWVEKKSAITIQRFFRGYMVRREQIKRIRKIIKVQSCVRRWLARRRLRELKIVARSVGHLQKLNTGLENKIIELQMKLSAETEERKRLSASSTKLEMLKAEMSLLEAERPTLLKAHQRMEELELEVERLETEVDVKEAQKGELETRIQHMDSQYQQLKMESESSIGELKEILETSQAESSRLAEERRKMDKAIASEAERRATAEQEMAQMREQLLQNANLLASPAFSRHGSLRQNGRSPSNSVLGMDGLPSMSTGTGDIDEIALILRQQHVINELRIKAEQYQRESERLRCVLEGSQLVDSLDKKTSLKAFEAQRLQELETAYSRLKLDVERLVAEKAEAGLENMNIKAFLDRIVEDNDRNGLWDGVQRDTNERHNCKRKFAVTLLCSDPKIRRQASRCFRMGKLTLALGRREESTELRAMLSSRFERQMQSGSPRPDSGHWSAAHSEDGSGSSDLDEELCMERQCRQLKSLAETLNQVVTERNREIQRLEKRLTETLPPFRPSDCSVEEQMRGVHGHLNHLAAENLALNEKLVRQADELAESRAQLRGFNSAGLGVASEAGSDSEIIRLETLSKEGVEHSALLEVFYVPEFARIIVCDLKPRLARLLTKCFPAYCLVTAFRYHDHSKDETAFTGLFSAFHIVLKDTVSRSCDVDILSLWLVNAWRLFNLLRQYSGENAETEWTACNTAKQNSHRMQSFDLSPIRDQLKLRIEECYQNLMKKAIEPVLSPKIVPGMLQHESSDELTVANGGKQTLSRQASRDTTPRRGLDDLLDFMNFIHAKLVVFGADPVLLSQIFGQMTSWICSLSLNHMMFRKELCNFEKAIQIKHNVMELQSWLQSKGLGAHKDTLLPLVQACHLLQSRKDESNLDTLCGELTDKLKPRQVVAILQHYAPSDDFEDRPIDADFLIVVQRKLNERAHAMGETDEDQKTLIMRGTYLPPFDTRPFVYSEFPLETLSLPSCLKLHQVARLL